MKLVKFIGYYVLGLIGIVLISASPALFYEGAFFDLRSYGLQLRDLIMSLGHPTEWTYWFKGQQVPMLDYIWEPYRYSMLLFFGGILLGVALAFFGAFFTLFLPKWIRTVVDRIVGLLEAVPDLLLAFSLQLFIVWFFKQTGWLIAPFTSLGEDKIYLLPIIAIAVLPMVMMYRILLLLMEEEMAKPYVQLALGKGLTKWNILSVHVVRNIVSSAFSHSKIIVWGALSSLLIIEYIFNINGITTVFIDDFRPIVSAFVLFLLFTPFYLLYQGTESFLIKDGRRLEEENLHMNSFMGTGKRTGGVRFSFIWREILAHFRNVKFLTGFLIIVSTVIVSIVYTMTADPLVDQYFQIYDENDRLVSGAPHTPEYVFLGTDVLGFSVFDQLLVGAKYTILFALAIAFLRIFIGFILAVPYTFFLPSKWQQGIEKLVDGMHFLPMTVIAYLLLRPVLWMPEGGFVTTETERILYQALILTLLAAPLVVTLFGKEMKGIMKEEFVVSTKVLGGSSVHLLWKHLLPHMSARIGVVFGQQFIQTLLIFIHLGVFDIYFGGTKVTYEPYQNDPPLSTTYEWSGLIGSAKNSLMTGRWWLIIPALLCFVVIIASMQLIIQGIKDVQQRRVGVPVEGLHLLRARRSKKEKRQTRYKDPATEDFTFMKRASGEGWRRDES
ncbi:ABC transporter permease subunit [Bacillus sp. SB49]|uniref:ABC transporter permease subunit n=1 Tax=Bacillus sp. SB49 TaxID=1071080 RepID=UPI00041181E2|nr:ABC transporter permease subunit [Bacillus sp. SB49]QHT48204.1 ABC transporter permease subunit [Bacillus sp. SB49]